jgi:ABC-type transport system involved in cytochrome c biogenesis ATPase subunit
VRPAPHPATRDAAEELLRVVGLSVAYGPRVALEGVSFTVPAGSLVAVIGPNGAGKSSLFKAILGAVPCREGEIRTAGRPAYVPQGDEARLDLPVTALDVALMGGYRDAPWWRPLGRRDRERARDALARMGVADLAARPIGELSGGQRQRVYLARALVQGGRTMLLDEPLATSAGKVAWPSAWAKKASRRITTQVPRSPAGTAASSTSASARRMKAGWKGSTRKCQSALRGRVLPEPGRERTPAARGPARIPAPCAPASPPCS